MATIAGMKTTYEARKAFADKLATLFERIEALNRPTPMTEGEYLEFATLVQQLHAFGQEFREDEVFVQLIASAQRPARAEPPPVQDKSQDPNFYFCKKCDNWIVKKGKAKHLRSARCNTIHNSKMIASRLTKTENEKIGKFAKSTNHPFFLAGQVIQRDYLLRKAPADLDERIETFHQYRLPVPVMTQEDTNELMAEIFGEDEDEPQNVVVCEPVPEPQTITIKVKRGGGRPKGAKNKPKPALVIEDEEEEEIPAPAPTQDAPNPRDQLLAERIRIRDEIQELFPPSYRPQPNLSKQEIIKKLKELEEVFKQGEKWLDEIETEEQIEEREMLSYNVRGMLVMLN